MIHILSKRREQQLNIHLCGGEKVRREIALRQDTNLSFYHTNNYRHDWNLTHDGEKLLYRRFSF